jgi:hypothetical protein
MMMMMMMMIELSEATTNALFRDFVTLRPNTFKTACLGSHKNRITNELVKTFKGNFRYKIQIFIRIHKLQLVDTINNALHYNSEIL